MNIRLILFGLAMAAALCASPGTACAQIFVTNGGATLNPALITGLDPGVPAVAVSGDKLFVVDISNGTIGEYTISGATVNATLISGLNNPSGIAVFGGNLFLTEEGIFGSATGTIGEY